MIPPRGFKAEMYPLRHRFVYGVGLNVLDETVNSTILTLVKNYKAAANPGLVKVNPHDDEFATESGAICASMSIIDKLTLTLRFNMTENATHIDDLNSIKMSWTPIFFSFPEKLDAVDEKSTATVASILALTKDATQEDITPAFATKITSTGNSDLPHPVSTTNFTEVFGTLNLTTTLVMEGVPFNMDTFHKALRYFTNKGALKACVGKTRHLTLSASGERISKTYHIRKFVPRSIRRIVPYTYFGILIHVPLDSAADQHYYSLLPTTAVAHIGVKAIVTYDEWNPEHDQTMSS